MDNSTCNCLGVYEVGTCKLRRDLGICKNKPAVKENVVEQLPELRQVKADPTIVELVKLAAAMRTLMFIHESSSPEQCIRTILENKKKGGDLP